MHIPLHANIVETTYSIFVKVDVDLARVDMKMYGFRRYLRGVKDGVLIIESQCWLTKML